MAEWNEQSAPNNNLKASDIRHAKYSTDPQASEKMNSKVHLQNKKIELDIRRQNL